MAFLEAYKRLDNLCKDMYSSDSGISTYIDNMKRIPTAGYKIKDWNSVYQKLVHYRHIRNQIVHENYATEENMCSESDTLWLENFYRQVLEIRDPLAQYQNSLRATQQRKNKVHASSQISQESSTQRQIRNTEASNSYDYSSEFSRLKPTQRRRRNAKTSSSSGHILSVFVIMAILTVIVFLFYLLLQAMR